MRLFIALDLPPEVKERLTQVQKKLRRHDRDTVRWVRPEGMHLTLRFLGEVPEGEVPPLASALARVAAAGRPFHLEARGFGVFPHLARPRVLWVGVGGDVEVLGALQREVERAVRALGYAAERRRYTPHLTLGRVRRQAELVDLLAFARELEKVQVPLLGRWQVTELLLMESELHPEGARYTRLQAWPLGAGG